jgi:hypothetical protein
MLEGPSPFLAAFTWVLWISFENPQIIRSEKKKIELKLDDFLWELQSIFFFEENINDADC